MMFLSPEVILFIVGSILDFWGVNQNNQILQ